MHCQQSARAAKKSPFKWYRICVSIFTWIYVCFCSPNAAADGGDEPHTSTNTVTTLHARIQIHVFSRTNVYTLVHIRTHERFDKAYEQSICIRGIQRNCKPIHETSICAWCVRRNRPKRDKFIVFVLVDTNTLTAFDWQKMYIYKWIEQFCWTIANENLIDLFDIIPQIKWIFYFHFR